MCMLMEISINLLPTQYILSEIGSLQQISTPPRAVPEQ